eukprot:700686-Pyramimonas_sp.AAC.1
MRLNKTSRPTPPTVVADGGQCKRPFNFPAASRTHLKRATSHQCGSHSRTLRTQFALCGVARYFASRT